MCYSNTMVNRRSFLISVAAVGLGQLAVGCSRSPAFRVRLLQNSIPPQVLGAFRKVLDAPVKLDFTPEEKLQELFALLQSWTPQGKGESAKRNWWPWRKRKVEVADLVTLGDYWLVEAIAEKLIQPLDLEEVSQWQKLPPRWQSLVKRNEKGELDENGAIWGAPYRWGTTLIAYRVDKFKELGWTPKDWSDLWREEIRDRISMINQPREVIGLTLKKLGYSYNTLNLREVANLKEELIALNQQVRLYSDDSYLEPLMMGDTWLAVGWSADILPLVKRYPNLNAIVPRSGTALWTDIWVKPVASTDDSLFKKWIEFCWQPLSASQISLFTPGTSPVIYNLQESELPEELLNNNLLLPNSEMIEESDFILPLPKAVAEEYLALWKEIRRVDS